MLFTHLLCSCHIVGIVYANFHMGQYRHIVYLLPEAIFYCLQACIILYCLCIVYILAFIVTSADMSKLWVCLAVLIIGRGYLLLL